MVNFGPKPLEIFQFGHTKEPSFIPSDLRPDKGNQPELCPSQFRNSQQELKQVFPFAKIHFTLKVMLSCFPYSNQEVTEDHLGKILYRPL